MNKILILVLFLGFRMFSQNFSGVANYEYKANPESIKTAVAGIPNLDENTRRMFEEKMRKNSEKTFVLTFDKFNSLYKEEEKLDLNNNGGNGSWSPYGMDVAFYKNFKDNIFITEKDLMGKIFFVKEELTNSNWILSSETKKIGNYVCLKATSVSDVKISISSDNSNATNFLENNNIPSQPTITAWYTTEIPISNGPTLYWGLPGLILEIEDDGNKLICSKIILNPKKKNKIKIPSNRELISTYNYGLIVDKKMKELESSDFVK